MKRKHTFFSIAQNGEGGGGGGGGGGGWWWWWLTQNQYTYIDMIIIIIL